MSEVRFDLLRKMPVFGGLSDETLRLFLDESRHQAMPPGGYFFREGDAAESLFVIESGSVIVERLWRGIPIELGRLHRGDCFGEMALIDLLPRSAAVRAAEECQAMEIPLRSLRSLFQRGLEQYAIIMMNMGREVSRRLRVADDRRFELEQMRLRDP